MLCVEDMQDNPDYRLVLELVLWVETATKLRERGIEFADCRVSGDPIP
jgi:hypothetical protein